MLLFSHLNTSIFCPKQAASWYISKPPAAGCIAQKK